MRQGIFADHSRFVVNIVAAGALVVPAIAHAQSQIVFEALRYRPARSPAETFVAVPSITTATDVAVGDQHACALLRDHSVRCWGSNARGQLGDGTTHNRVSPVAVAGLVDVAQIAIGTSHTCARTNSGTVSCWGANEYGQVTVAPTNSGVSHATPIAGLTDVVDIASSGDSLCAVRRDGSVRCWGANFAGQLGDGTRVDSHSLVTVRGLSDATQISMGGNATCARTRRGTVICWGADDRGQLGIGPYVEQCAPSREVSLHDVTAVAAGDYFACALNARGFVQCWGEVGDDGTHGFTASPVPIDFAGGRPLDQVSRVSARGTQACFVRRDASVACMQVEVASSGRPTARVDHGLASVASIAMRPPVRCVAVSDGRVLCAGPSSEAVPVPMPVPVPAPRPSPR